jgi:hypothetical protein
MSSSLNLKQTKSFQKQFDATTLSYLKKTSKYIDTPCDLCYTLCVFNNKEKYMLIEAASCQEYERKGADAEVQEHWAYVEQA